MQLIPADIEVTATGLTRLLSNIDASKPSGPDGVTGILIKTFANITVKAFTAILNYSLQTATLPKLWKIARVKPIFKK